MYQLRVFDGAVTIISTRCSVSEGRKGQVSGRKTLEARDRRDPPGIVVRGQLLTAQTRIKSTIYLDLPLANSMA